MSRERAELWLLVGTGLFTAVALLCLKAVVAGVLTITGNMP